MFRSPAPKPMGWGHSAIADHDPRVDRIAPFVQLPRLPVWLVVPRALRHVPRVARVRQALASCLAKI